MLPETISPKLLDMTHMFIATYGKNPITNHDEVRVETLKFVIKHGHVGVSSEGYATPNLTELSKLTDMFFPVYVVTVNKNPVTNQWTYPVTAYMQEELSDHFLDTASDLYNSNAVHTLEEFKEQYEFFAAMLPEEYAARNPLMIGFYRKFDNENPMINLGEVGGFASDSEPAPYLKKQSFYKHWESDFGSFSDKIALFTIRGARVEGQKLYDLDYFALQTQTGGDLKAHRVVDFSDDKTRHRMPLFHILEQLVDSEDFTLPIEVLGNSYLLDNVYGTSSKRRAPEAPWFSVPWASKTGGVETEPMNHVLMTPPEYAPYELPDPQFFLDLLPEEFTGSNLVALGFVSPEYSHSATLSEILKAHAEQEQEQEQEQESSPLDDLQPMSRAVTIDETDTTKQQNPRDLWDGKVHILNPNTNKYEELKMMTDEQFRNMTFNTQQPNPQINPDHYRNFSNNTEVIDITENLSYNGGNAVKYLARATRLDGQTKHENPLTDLRKAKWYIEREIDRLERGNE